jgi:hypothetical protein
VTDYLRNSFQRKAWADAHAKYVERVNEAWQREHASQMFPSSDGGGRQGVSPLGGVALPAAEKEPR